MRNPTLKYKNRGAAVQSKFAGLDANALPGKKAMTEALNISSDEYGALTVRAPRRVAGGAPSGTVQAFLPVFENAQTPLAFTGIKNRKLYYRGNEIEADTALGASISSGQKKLIDHGGRLIILPDMMYYDYTAAQSDPTQKLKPLNLTFGYDTGYLGWAYNAAEDYNNILFDVESCRDDFSSEAFELVNKRFFELSNGDSLAAAWSGGANTYRRIIIPTVENALPDEIADGKPLYCVIKGRDDTTNGDFLRWVLEVKNRAGETVSIRRTAGEYSWIYKVFPKMTDMCGFGSRTFGVNKKRIYFSSSSNPYSFQAFTADRSASFACDIPSGGNFTAVGAFKTKAVAFKDSEMHEFYEGSTGITRGASYGVGCIDKRSVASNENGMYFLSRSGVYFYNGGVPQKIKMPFSGGFTAGEACLTPEYYYLLATLDDGGKRLIVYDVANKTWHEEDAQGLGYLSAWHERVYALNSGGDMVVFGSGDEEISWSVTLAPFTGETLENKAPYAVALRAYLSADASARVLIKTEEDDDFFDIGEITHCGKISSFFIPFMSRSCDNFEVKISGRGYAKIYALERLYSKGGRNL